MPQLQRLPPHQTQSHPLAPIFSDESTIEGNLQIHEKIELQAFGQNPDDQTWAHKLRPVFGDLKTIARISACQSLRSTAQRPFDSRRWIVPGLGLWHLRLNLLRLIHKIHWGGSSPIDSSTLQFAADAWNRSNVHVPNDFAKLEALLLDSYKARISCLLFESCSHRARPGIQPLIKYLRRRPRTEYMKILESIYTRIYPDTFRNPNKVTAQNEVQENHLRYIRHMDIYCILRYAIKYGDIGLLRIALQECCILFQAKEGSTFHYGPELLRLLHLYTSSSASDHELQEAMLANSLVNLSGYTSSFFEMYRFLEFLNGRLKEVMKDRRSSTKPIKNLLSQIALTIPYILKLKMTLHEYCGRWRSSQHPETDVSEDLRIMALDIWKRDFSKTSRERFTGWEATDLIRSGAASLGDNLLKYNASTIGRGQWDTDEGIPDNLNEHIDEDERPVSPTEALFQDAGLL